MGLLRAASMIENLMAVEAGGSATLAGPDAPAAPALEAALLVLDAQTLAETALRLRRGAKPGEALPLEVSPSDSAEADRLSAEATQHLIRAEQMLAQKAQP